MADAVLALRVQFGGADAQLGIEEHRVVAEAAVAAALVTGSVRTDAFGDERLRILGVPEQHDHRVEVRTALRLRHVEQRIEQLVDVGPGIAVAAGKARRIQSGRPPSASTQSPESSPNAGIPVSRAALRAFSSAFSTKVSPVSSASPMPSSPCVTNSIPLSPSISAVIVLLRHAEDPQPLIAEGVWSGRILHERRGDGGFGYDPVFFDPELGVCAAELDAQRKNRISHRGRALAALRRKTLASE